MSHFLPPFARMRQIKASAPPPIPREEAPAPPSITEALALLETLQSPAEVVESVEFIEESPVEEIPVVEEIAETAPQEEIPVVEETNETSPEEIAEIAPAEDPKGEVPLENLSRSQMVDLCKTLGIPNYGTKLEILNRLRAHTSR